MPASSKAIVIARAGFAPTGSGSVMWLRVGGDAVAEQLGVDLRAARLRVLELLEDDHAPASPMTKPSRPGVEGPARAPPDRRCDGRARASRAKPAIPTSVTGASVPPQSMTSARPSRIASSPSPIAMFEAAQAVHCDESGPCVPSSIETQAAPMFGMISGIENGLTRSGPRSQQLVVAVLERLQAADPGRDRGADPVGLRGDRRARSRPPPAARRRRSGARSGPCAAACLRSMNVGRVEVLDLAGEVTVKPRRVELRDRRPRRSARRSGRPTSSRRRCRAASPRRGR